MKKIVCILICFCITLCLASCKQGNTDNGSSQSNMTELSGGSKTGKNAISLLYSYGDAFDPYTATTDANRQLALLLYDCLVKTDNDFNVQYNLAQSVEIADRVCTVKLRDALFTDGSEVTASDVIYSYNLAKNCLRYAYNFYEVAGVSAADSKTVIFNLSQGDPYFVNLLDFPIIKSGTSGVTDADGKKIAPIGSGRYILSDDGLSFRLNENYYGKKGIIETINLINSPDATSTSHYVEIGATQIYYAEGNNIVRMSGKRTDVNLNRFVYIGINSSYGSLQSREMRYAISSALDRSAICSTAYYNNAEPASGFFNPYFKPASVHQTIEKTPNVKITVENLSKIGYNNLNSSGFYANTSGNNPSFTLLVNSENASRVSAAGLIAAQCKAAGIQINVVECSYEQYAARLASGDFQLYLGEIQILDNMDFSNLVIAGGSAAYGVGLEKNSSDGPTDASSENGEGEAQAAPQSNSCEQMISAYRNGECGISDLAGTLITEMPQIPVCYLKSVLFYDSSIIGGVSASTSDIYLSIENYEF